MKTKHASQTAPARSWKNAILLTITALGLSVSTAFGTTTRWTDDVGIWHTSANWDYGEPTPTTPAEINNGGTAQIFTDFPMANALSLTLGLNAGESGNVEVSAGFGDLDVGEAIFVGKGGAGKLTITQGTVNSASASIASLAGQLWVSTGSATVDGGSSYWIISGEADVGGTTSAAGGTGLLTVTNSGTVTAANVHVWDSGTLTGNGTVSTTNGTTVDGTLSPKGGGTTLSIGGNVQLKLGATTQCNVTPQDSSTTPQVSVSGQVSLGGRLSVTMTGDFSLAPTRFTLRYADSVDLNHLKFNSQSITYPTGHCWHPVITYDNTGGHYHVYLDRVYDCN
jgi:hypothetical protein